MSTLKQLAQLYNDLGSRVENVDSNNLFESIQREMDIEKSKRNNMPISEMNKQRLQDILNSDKEQGEVPSKITITVTENQKEVAHYYRVLKEFEEYMRKEKYTLKEYMLLCIKIQNDFRKVTTVTRLHTITKSLFKCLYLSLNKDIKINVVEQVSFLENSSKYFKDFTVKEYMAFFLDNYEILMERLYASNLEKDRSDYILSVLLDLIGD